VRRVVIQFLPDDARDARLACVVEDGLTNAGYDVAVDDRGQFGVAWARRLEAEMKDAGAVIVLLSAASKRDAILSYQLEAALRAIGRDGKGPLLVLIRVSYDGPLPGALGSDPGNARVGRWTEEGDDELLLGWLLEELATRGAVAGAGSGAPTDGGR
jgi:hypothetical protein